ncbi:MAG: deoxyribose-phosphate aldolase [Acidaminococcaceae bacterium]|nr:deoxyribose-phosphate aldolase [Acidaminococcaceae bacterium]
MSFANYLEHTMLKPEASEEEIKKLCAEAAAYNMRSVCVNPCHVALSKRALEGSGVSVVTVIGFPLGAERSEVKALEAKLAVHDDGADEVDMVLNIGALKEGRYNVVCDDITAVVKAAAPAPVKVIIETCLLTDEEKITACRVIKEAGAHFVKTSTGFSKGGAVVSDVKILSAEAKKLDLLVKAAGSIRDLQTALAMINAGADRIGTSAGVKILREESER